MDIVYWIMHLPADFLHSFGYLIVFWLVWVEWIPPLWVFSPWQTIMLLGWFLARMWVFNIFVLIFIWFIWSFLWDLLWYFMWKKLWFPFLNKYWKYVFIKKDGLEKAKNMLDKHFLKTVFFSRFYGWTRVITPFLCGVSHISLSKYIWGSLMSALSWSVFWWVIWYIFGHSYELIWKNMWRFMFFAMIFGVLMIFVYRYVNKKKHIFNREYIYTLIANILSVVILAKLADEIAWYQSIVRIDSIINIKVNLLSSPLLDKIMFAINNIWNIYVMIWLSILFLIYLIYKKKKYHYWLFMLGSVWWFLIDVFMKVFIGRLRPDNALIFLRDYSFPSGHTTMATILFLTVWVIFENDIKSKRNQLWFFLLCFIPIIIIWFSRIYLNVHWFSDVIWWFFLWVFWITFMILILRFIMTNKLDDSTIDIP